MIRLFIGLLFAFGSLAFSANATEEIESTITYVTGNGSNSGFCDGNSGSYFCIDQLEERAEREALRDAQWTCQMRQGQADTFGASCSNFCTPNYIPPGSSQQYVSCRSNCSVRCEIPSRTVEIQE